MTAEGRTQAKPGRITFVGSGPGDPGLLTTRARSGAGQRRAGVHRSRRAGSGARPGGFRAAAAVGPDAEPVRAAMRRRPTADTDRRRRSAGASRWPDVRPALGDPAEVAKTLANRGTHRRRRRSAGGRRSAVGGRGDHRGDGAGEDAPEFRDRAGPARHHRGAHLRGAAAGLGAHRRRRPRRRGLGGTGRRARPADPARHRVASARGGAHADRVRAGRHHADRGDGERHDVPAAFGGDHAGRPARQGRAGGHRARRAVGRVRWS